MYLQDEVVFYKLIQFSIIILLDMDFHGEACLYVVSSTTWVEILTNCPLNHTNRIKKGRITLDKLSKRCNNRDNEVNRLD